MKLILAATCTETNRGFAKGARLWNRVFSLTFFTQYTTFRPSTTHYKFLHWNCIF